MRIRAAVSGRYRGLLFEEGEEYEVEDWLGRELVEAGTAAEVGGPGPAAGASRGAAATVWLHRHEGDGEI